MAKATDIQIGGDHYKLPIQPIEYIWKNKLNFFQGNIIKYILRYKKKNGLIDLEKCHDYLDELIDTEKKMGENYGAQQHRSSYVAGGSNVQRRPNR